jgi:uncharacterized membrane protein
MLQLPSVYRGQTRLIAALCLSSALSIALLAARALYTGYLSWEFLAWNLCLAWIPMVMALGAWASGRDRRHPGLVTAGLLAAWLLFFPNAPYILTDLIHLAPRAPVPVWFDALMIFSFAWNGLMLGFVSLWIVQNLVRGWYGDIVAWLAAAVSLAAASFGIYLGRFQRWNSWDVLTQPHALATDVLERVLNPLAHPQTVAISLLFFGLLTVAYLTTVLLAGSRWRQEMQS